MKKIIGACLVALSLLACTQPSFARNFKKHTAGAQTTQATTQSSHGATGLLLGTFDTDCAFFETNGNARAEFATVAIDDTHNQTAVHLKANGGAAAYADLEFPHSPTFLKTPFTFNLVKGNGNFLGVEVSFIPHGSTETSFIDFATPDSKLYKFFDNVVPLIDNGHGGFIVPGIPQGAQITDFFFVEFGNPNDCDNKNSYVNRLTLNNRVIGLDTNAAAAFCNFGCGECGEK